MYKIRYAGLLPTKGKVCGAIFDRKYKQFDFDFLSRVDLNKSLYNQPKPYFF
jgi:hypothetical protein